MVNLELKIENYKMRKSLRNSTVYFALFAVALFFISAFSTKAQSVDSLVSEAVKNNPQLKSLQYKITASERRTESINTLPAPNLSVEFSQVPTNSIDILNQSNSNNIALSQIFHLGGK